MDAEKIPDSVPVTVGTATGAPSLKSAESTTRASIGVPAIGVVGDLSQAFDATAITETTVKMRIKLFPFST